MSFNLFETRNNQLLPALCKPFPDELLSSWMARMAYQHGLTTKEMCTYIWPSYSGNPDIDRIISDANLNILAEKTNCTFAEVNATTMAFYKHVLFAQKNLLYAPEQWIIPSKRIGSKSGYMQHSSGLMFCPKCLESEPYFKKQWRLAISFACTKCGYYLIESCPHCHKGNSFIDVRQPNFAHQSVYEHMVYCHHCGKDVTDCEPEIAPVRVVKTQQLLFEIMEHGLNEKVIYTESYFKVLHHIALLLLIDKQTDRNIKKLAEHVYRENNVSHSDLRPYVATIIRDLPVKKRSVVIMLAHWMLQEWPHRFIDLCLAHNIKKSTLLSDFPNAPYWFWEAVRHGLEPSFPVKIDNLQHDNSDNCTVRMKEPCLKRLDYDYDEYFYDDNRYEDDDSDYINPDNLERIQRLYGIDNTRRLRYLYSREKRWN
jgi:hypothetical protein